MLVGKLYLYQHLLNVWRLPQNIPDVTGHRNMLILTSRINQEKGETYLTCANRVALIDASELLVLQISSTDFVK